MFFRGAPGLGFGGATIFGGLGSYKTIGTSYYVFYVKSGAGNNASGEVSGKDSVGLTDKISVWFSFFYVSSTADTYFLISNDCDYLFGFWGTGGNGIFLRGTPGLPLGGPTIFGGFGSYSTIEGAFYEFFYIWVKAYDT